MARIQNMVRELSREVERLGCEVMHTETADARHAVIVTDRAAKHAPVKLSKVLPGCIFIGGAHITWASSNFAVALHTVETFEKLKSVRHATQEICGESAPYSVGSCARKLINWLGDPLPGTPKLREIIGDWHYQKCEPCEMAHAYQFDLAGCYFNLLRRMPSLSPAFTSKEIFWRVTPDDERERFARLVVGIEYVKPLRNAIVGAMFGGSKQIFLQAGASKEFKTAPGARPCVAAVIVRTAYEVCQLQAELSEAVYANADSVISAQSVPTFWRDLGLPYTLCAQGAAVVQGIGKYMVGTKRTDNYLGDTTGKRKAARESRRVDPVYWRWLTCERPLLG